MYCIRNDSGPLRFKLFCPFNREITGSKSGSLFTITLKLARITQCSMCIIIWMAKCSWKGSLFTLQKRLMQFQLLTICDVFDGNQIRVFQCGSWVRATTPCHILNISLNEYKSKTLVSALKNHE